MWQVDNTLGQEVNPADATYSGTKWTVLQSAHCYHFQELTEVHKQLKTKNNNYDLQ